LLNKSHIVGNGYSFNFISKSWSLNGEDAEQKYS